LRACGRIYHAEFFWNDERSTLDAQRPTFNIELQTIAIRNPKSEIGRADDGIRTRDLRFTKPLLYQLSYVGKYLNMLHLRSDMRESNSHE
jgi:hypothetical protein